MHLKPLICFVLIAACFLPNKSVNSAKTNFIQIPTGNRTGLNRKVQTSSRRVRFSRIAKSCNGAAGTDLLEHWPKYADAVFTATVEQVDKNASHLVVGLRRIVRSKVDYSWRNWTWRNKTASPNSIESSGQRLLIVHGLFEVKTHCVPQFRIHVKDVLLFLVKTNAVNHTLHLAAAPLRVTLRNLRLVHSSTGELMGQFQWLLILATLSCCCWHKLSIAARAKRFAFIDHLPCTSIDSRQLQEKLHMSQVAFFGSVVSYKDATEESKEILQVRIKRIFNGHEHLKNQQMATLIRFPKVSHHESCPRSKLRQKDTRIFFGNVVKNRENSSETPVVELSFSPIAVSLRNLRSFRHNLQDVTHGSRGAPVSNSTPATEKIDPCLQLKCPPGAKCLAAIDGLSAQCQCPNKCPNYGDSTGSRPICGADGKDYPNMCELQKAMCLLNQSIEIKFQGFCDPCSTLECPAPSVCILDADRKPHCRCDKTCPSDFNPVCGSDGRSYSSQCHLFQEACRTQRNIRILYKGVCETGFHPCSTSGCRADQECQVDESGSAQCVCPGGPCPPVYRPVCGSDGITYPSQCRLVRDSCTHNRNVTLAYEGACGPSHVCSSFRCPPGGYCVEQAGYPRCHCPPCGGEWDPVCGSDGVTYTNPCRIRFEVCRSNKIIKIAYKGLCNGCDKKQCDFYAQCESDAVGVARCVCPKGCIELPDSPVCGTDGVTYRNECELKSAACLKQQFIVVASPGDCDLCKNVRCQHGARCEEGACVCPTHCPSPATPTSSSIAGVCATDGRTYPSECHMQKAACDNGVVLHALHLGPCRTVTAADLILDVSYYNETGYHQKCDCSKSGSLDDTCDPVTLQCRCKVGVGGHNCDICLQTFWGFHQLTDNSSGCLPCNCHPLGSLRDDCDQTTGRCVCRAHATGQKCDRCLSGELIDHSTNGCGPNGNIEHESPHCSDLTCSFGAICQDLHGQAVCVCPMDCPTGSEGQAVCGSDSVTYPSECDLRLAACRKQSRIDVAYEGPCVGDINAGAVSKTTRHVPELEMHDWNRKDLISLGKVGSKINEHGFSQPVWRPTLASVQIRGFLGDPCLRDADCTSVANTVCVLRICACASGFAPSLDKRSCVANDPLVSTEADQSSCASSPCLGGGTCQPLGLESFICVCPPERTGSLCERRIQGQDEEVDSSETPAFHGQSFIELKKLKAHDKFSVEVEFKSLLADGILLFAQSRDATAGDFISLALIAGHVELRFDLGNGAMILRSLQQIRLGHWHRVVAHRYRQDGWLRLDNDEDVATTSPGNHQSLDLDTNTFLGNVPLTMATSRVFEKIGTASGFVGCMRRLKLGRKSINFQVPGPGEKKKARHHHRIHEQRNSLDANSVSTSTTASKTSTNSFVIRMSGITQCGDNPCRRAPCANEATCVWKSGQNFTCICKQGFTGKLCETAINPCSSNPCSEGSTCLNSNGTFLCKCPQGLKGQLCDQYETPKHEVLVPDFSSAPENSGGSFIAIPGPFQVGQNLDLEVWFLPRSFDGILLYAAQGQNGRGDFVWLALIGGRLQFRWDLGSGAGVVTSSERVSLFNWHRVTVSRRGKDATLRLNEGLEHSGKSLGPLSELTLDTPFFLGGYQSNITLPRDVPKLASFQGAIQRVIVNGDVIDKLMEPSIQHHGVGVYRGLPCSPSTTGNGQFKSKEAAAGPCLNEGICQPILASFVCKCPLGFMGKRCEKRTNEVNRTKAVRFAGKTFLKFPNQLKDVGNDSRLLYLWGESINYTNSSDTESLELDTDSLDVVYDFAVDYESAKSQRSNRFELRFRTDSENGLIVWLSRGRTLQADYFALAVVHSHVELSFNLGRQTAFLTARSTVNVSDGHWHTVTAERKKRLALLQVDTEKPVRVTADSGATILNSSGKLWIGGCPSLPSGLPSPYYEGFSGCIASVKVDRHHLDWLRHGDNTLLQFCEDTS